jgi:DNA topoisomerase-1
LKRRGLPREKATAAIVRLLESTLIRVGNEEYAETNGSFGLTTLRNRHARVHRSVIRFSFRGKSGIKREVEFHDARLAKIVRKCQDLPGQELFGYLDEEGEARDIGSADVNEYLRQVTGQDFTAKDFRTWAGTALAAQALREFEDFDSEAAAKRNITKAIERVAARLGNTKAVCRKCYIHPAVIDAYLDRSLIEVLEQRAEEELRTFLPGLPPEEAVVLALLQQRMEKQLDGKRRRVRRVAARPRRRKPAGHRS